jgi:hypothetical protein
MQQVVISLIIVFAFIFVHGEHGPVRELVIKSEDRTLSGRITLVSYRFDNVVKTI